MIQPVDLTTRQRKFGMYVMIINSFMMWGGFFMVVPLISIHYVEQLGWATATIGIVLGVRQLFQQGFTVVGGMLADRFGARLLILCGLIMRFVGFGAMAWADTFPLLLGSAIFAALGGALFDSPSSATIAALTTSENRARFFSILGVVRNLGMAIGPLIGTWLLDYNFGIVAIAAGSCYIIAWIATYVLLPDVAVATGQGKITAGIGMALRDGRFMLFNALLLGYWFMWTQITLAIPLKATDISGDNSAVSWVYGVNSLMSIVLQYPLMRITERYLSPASTLVLGIAIMSIGLGAIAIAPTSTVLLVCVALYSLGGLLSSPSQQTVAANLANSAALGSYFGVAGLAIAVGGGMGSFSGGTLYGLGTSLQQPYLPWLTFMGVGIITGILLVVYFHRYQMLRQQSANSSQ
ncbi:MAG: MFS transporter [Roseiflexaceae bacterium]|jgi:DHA1 family multidrug resistance protein-like MFS transporter|nr:MFS transporter [Chloroflexaceae bacterium]